MDWSSVRRGKPARSSGVASAVLPSSSRSATSAGIAAALPATRDGFATNVNVIAVDLPGGAVPVRFDPAAPETLAPALEGVEALPGQHDVRMLVTRHVVPPSLPSRSRPASGIVLLTPGLSLNPTYIVGFTDPL